MPPRNFSPVPPGSSIAGLLMPPSSAEAAARPGASVPYFVSCRLGTCRPTHSSSASELFGSSTSHFSANASSSRHLRADRRRHLDYDRLSRSPHRINCVLPHFTDQRDHFSAVQYPERGPIRRHVSHLQRTAVELRAWSRWPQSTHHLARRDCPGRFGL